MTDLTLTPSTPQPGETLTISADYANTGSVPITGTATIQVLDLLEDTIVATYRQPLPLVAPGEHTPIQATWILPDAGLRPYKISVWVLYHARSTQALQAVVRPGQNIYLPAVWP